MEANKNRVIAVDFDGCICTIAPFPGIGEPNWDVINKLIALQSEGAKLILWTCRTDDALKAAIDACLAWGLTFDAINDSLPEWKARWGNDPRKIGASEYWDDRAVTVKASSLIPEIRTSLKTLKPGATAFVLSRKDYGSSRPVIISEWEVSKIGREYLYLAKFKNDSNPYQFRLDSGLCATETWDGLRYEAFATRNEAERVMRWWELYSTVCYKPLSRILKSATVEELEQFEMILSRCMKRAVRQEAQ